MKKILHWISDNLLYVYTLFLLAFIPLYPKLPLIDIKNTWVYVRFDDFAIVLAVLLFAVQLLRRKATLKTPLTLPIVIFWIVGLLSTIFGIVFIFPKLSGVFPNLAVLYYARHIEYMVLFFVAFSAVKSRKQLYGVLAVTIFTLLIVVGYGLGQRYFGFEAFLTMNEEFAKGTPLRLSALARIPSTFAGHYDLAAYLVLIISVVVAMITGFKHWGLKVLMLLSAVAGLVLLLMTASRVSFAVYLATITFLLILQKKKLFIIPAIVLSILLSTTFEGITSRFQSTISQADVVVDARTGKAIGIAKEVNEDGKKKVVIDEKQSTGENLPQGSGFINIPSTGKGESQIVYKRSNIINGEHEEGETTLKGDFVVKKVLAYDVSFTTRLQGTWPRALDAFKRNLLLGSGYSSINLASDGNYLRMLGETGALGTVSFLSIFLIYGIYVYRLLPSIKSRVTKAFVLGVSAGLFGLGLNAVLIDVFEASKVAYMMWMMMGLALGFALLSHDKKLDIWTDLKKVLVSIPAIVIYIVLGVVVVYWNSLSNYFVGDDFTWLRWAADCRVYAPQLHGSCPSIGTTFTQYFTDAHNFFYRPGTKIYFYLMYSLFWLNPILYHVGQILIHAVTGVVLFLLSWRLLKSKLFAGVAVVLFLPLSGMYEALFWISVSGHLLSVFFVVLGLLFYSYWQSSKHIVLLLLSIVSLVLAPFFHEYAVVGPLLIILLSLVETKNSVIKTLRSIWWSYLPYLALIPAYLFMRVSAGSAGFQGDYNYNLIKLPVNFLGNIFGYVMLAVAGVNSLPLYQSLRMSLRDNMLLALGIGAVAAVLVLGALWWLWKNEHRDARRLTLFGLGFFVISMLPFVGLGNMTERYLYFGAFGLVFLATLVIRSLFEVVSKQNRVASYILLCAILVSFVGFHVSQLQKINKDWTHASTITRTTVQDFGAYVATNDLKNPVFYFINVPTRIGYAWVFPLGLDDALWFPAQNINLTIRTTNSLQDAVSAAEASSSARIFEFNKDGSLDAIVRTKVLINE